MSIVAVDPVAKVDFVPESEKRKKEPTTFFVRPLKESEKAPLLEEMFPDDDMDDAVEKKQARIRTTLLASIFKKTLSGWENFKDSAGNPVQFNSRNQDANIDRIPFEVAAEGGSFVFSISKFTETETKN